MQENAGLGARSAAAARSPLPASVTIGCVVASMLRLSKSVTPPSPEEYTAVPAVASTFMPLSSVSIDDHERLESVAYGNEAPPSVLTYTDCVVVAMTYSLEPSAFDAAPVSVLGFPGGLTPAVL